MRAITLMQPWASLIALGAKRYETRSWKTHYRGPLAIHSSRDFSKASRALCHCEPFARPWPGRSEKRSRITRHWSRLEMNLHEAIVSLIDFARERDAETDPRLARALRIVGKKADRLREKHEARSAVIHVDPTAPLVMGRSQIVADFNSHFCRCRPRAAVCTVCYYRLAPRFRKALQNGFGFGFEQSYELALSELGHLPEQLTPAFNYAAQ